MGLPHTHALCMTWIKFCFLAEVQQNTHCYICCLQRPQGHRYACRSNSNCARQDHITAHIPTQHQHALFLQHVTATVDAVDNPNHSNDIQTEFDIFYSKMINLLNRFYLIRTVTVSCRDPDFITPAIKAKLRRKNRLMRTGRVEEAEVVAKGSSTYYVINLYAILDSPSLFRHQTSSGSNPPMMTSSLTAFAIWHQWLFCFNYPKCQVVSGCCKSQEWITDDGG